MDMTIKQAAKLTGFNAASLRALARRGQLPGAYRIAGHWRVNREVFERHRNGQANVKPKAVGEVE